MSQKECRFSLLSIVGILLVILIPPNTSLFAQSTSCGTFGLSPEMPSNCDSELGATFTLSFTPTDPEQVNIQYKIFDASWLFLDVEVVDATMVTFENFPYVGLVYAEIEARDPFFQNICRDTFSFEIVQSAEVQIEATQTNLSCTDQEIVLGSNLQNTAGVTFIWSGENLEATTPTVTITEPGTYTLTATINECSATDEIIITEEDCTPSIFLPPNISIDSCGKLIEASGFSSCTNNLVYEWSGPNDFFSNAPIIEVADGGTYTLTVTEPQSGCSDSQSTMVTIAPGLVIPNVIIQGSDQIDCNAVVVSLNGGASSGGNDLMYAWELNGQVIGQTSIINASEPGVYNLTVSNDAGCSATEAFQVIENTLAPEASLSVEPSVTICQGAAISVEAIVLNDSEVTEASYSWSDGQSGEQAFFSEAGFYQVTITNLETGCAAVPVGFSLFVEEIGLDSIQVVGEPMDGESFDILFEVAPDDTPFMWTYNAAASQNITAIQGSAESGTENIVGVSFTLTDETQTGFAQFDLVINGVSCVLDSAFVVAIQGEEEDPMDPEVVILNIPEIISPNGDGANDEWNITFPNAGDAANYRVEIFNRSGGVVWEQDNLNIPWNAANCSNGTYFYILTNKLTDETLKGAVSIIGKE